MALPLSTSSKPSSGNWLASTRTNSKELYLLSLVDLRGPNIPEAEIDIPVTEYVFVMNPKSKDMDESAAINIAPTQDGGQFIEHQGQIYKNISISGTTGLRPNKGPKSLIPVLNLVNPFADPATDINTGLPRGERTGFEEFMRLRNLFRGYWDLKNLPSHAPYIVMTWKDFKEDEAYIVEPMSFRSKADSGSPLTSSYDIQLRTISRLEHLTRNLISDPLKEQNALVKLGTRIRDAVRQMETAVSFIENVLDRSSSIGLATINQVLIPANNVIKELSGFTGTNKSHTISKQVLTGIATGARNIKVSLDEIDSTFTSNGITTNTSLSSHAYKEIMRSSLKLLQESSLFGEKTSTTISRKGAAYIDPILGPARSGGSLTNLNNVSSSSGAADSIVNKGENIRILTQRLLGDSSRYKEIVILNNLRAPYISDNPQTSGVLKPGDIVLYPKSSVFSGNVVSISESKIKNKSPIDLIYGTDIKLEKKEAMSGIVLSDLAKNSKGDLDTISGPDNFKQAIDIKFNTEQNELPTHPTFGGLFSIGTKAKQSSLMQFSINVKSTILSDSRTADIKSLIINAIGNVLNIQSEVIGKGSDQALLLNTDIRG